MIPKIISLGKRALAIFTKERASSRGAAIAFYTVTSIVPILVIVMAVAGLVFGQEAASGAIYQQFSGLLGPDGADLLQKSILGASDTSGGITATIISVVTLLLGASGVFLELEDALNAMWEAKAPEGLAGMARARLASLGLVIALGFLLIVSLVIDSALNALGGFLPLSGPLILVVSVVVAVALLAALFAAIFKFLPATPVAWRDVKFGAIVTAILFEVGKFLIGMYLGKSATVSSLGAAGALLALLFWVYYSSQIFLFGAALTKARAEASGRSGAAQTLVSASAGSTVVATQQREETISFWTIAAFVAARAVGVMVRERWDRRVAAQAKRRTVQKGRAL